MIIPIRCMSCGKLLADKYLYYRRRLREEGVAQRTYFDGTSVPVTAEAKIMRELALTRPCCRTALLTHVDLSAKL